MSSIQECLLSILLFNNPIETSFTSQLAVATSLSSIGQTAQNLADHDLRRRDFVAAEKGYRIARSLCPMADGPLNGLARIALTRTDFDRALRLVSESIELRPNIANSYALRATILCGMQEYEKALRDCRVAVRIEPSNALNHTVLGTCLQYLERYDESTSSLSRAICLAPDYPTPYRTRLYNWIHVSNFENAMRDADRLIALVRDAGSLCVKAEVYRAMGRYTDALVWHDESVRLFPRQVMLRLRAYTRSLAGQYQDALRDYQAAEFSEPNDAMTLCELARFYACVPDPTYRRPDDALRLALAADKLTNGKILYMKLGIAAALASQKQFQLAVQIQDKAVRDSRHVSRDDRQLADAQRRCFVLGQPYFFEKPK